jgi:hypothetical protein
MQKNRNTPSPPKSFVLEKRAFDFTRWGLPGG